MGHPKKQRKKYEKPKRPYDKEKINYEKQIKKEFGLRRKKEIWRAESILRNIRRRARELQARPDEKLEKELLSKMMRMGFIEDNGNLEDVLDIDIQKILSRRIQSVLHKKGFASTPKHARQMVIHRHVRVNDRVVKWPSYIVKKGEESKINVKENVKIGEKT